MEDIANKDKKKKLRRNEITSTVKKMKIHSVESSFLVLSPIQAKT
jgi:hypothetical protein